MKTNRDIAFAVINNILNSIDDLREQIRRAAGDEEGIGDERTDEIANDVVEEIDELRKKYGSRPACYLAVSPGYWGRGSTPEKAKEKLKEEGGKPREAKLFKVEGDHKAYVSDDGCICYQHVAELIRDIKGAKRPKGR